jgi:DNA-binding transcriptional MerR regulator/methylmalonyl-CoA mutase cobalamin-binding subunit
MYNTSPSFNLKVVLKETGIAADTLRAWERRYGLPMPQRTQGGHRLYSEHDIATIKWLMTRQVEGLSISRAVDLWNEQSASGTDPLAGFIPPTLTSTQPTLNLALPPETTLDTMRSHWIAACLNFNETNAEQILNQAFSIFPIEAVCAEILQRGLSEIGGMWYENRASVQQEHFASGLAMRRLDALLISSAPPSRSQTILVGCPANEWHTFTPLMLSLFLRRRGYNVIHLGANVPTERFAETVQAVHASLVILAAQTLPSAAALQKTALALSLSNIPVAYGGRIFNLHSGLAQSIPAFHLGSDVSASLTEIERILTGKHKKRQTQALSPEYTAAFEFFTAHRADIELTLKTMLKSLKIASENFQTGILFLGDNITAALQLGSMEYVSEEMNWVQYLLQAHDRPGEVLGYFIDAYARAVDKHLNGSGKPVVDWLKAERQKLKAQI